MQMPKHGLRAFGLAIMAALGLMAFFAVSAQPEDLTNGGEAGLFLIAKKGFTSELKAKGTLEQEGTGVLQVPGRKLAILCETGTGTGEFLSDTDAHATVSFSKCTTWVYVELVIEKKLAHKTKIPCEVLEPIVANALALPKKHGGESFILFEQKTGAKNFAEIILHGAECPLPLTNEVQGTVVALIEPLTNDTVEPLVLFNHAIQKLLGDKLIYGDSLNGFFEAFLEGSAKGRLGIPHAGMTLGVS